MNCITVFNNKGGVGKTSLVYHLAWMYAELDYNVLVADLDPQANLTSMFLDDDELEELWTRDGAGGTIYSALRLPAPFRKCAAMAGLKMSSSSMASSSNLH